MSRSPTNSSRNSRRRLLSEREYRREQRALHDLGQVHEREDRPVEVREVRAEDGLFLVVEVLRHVLHGPPRIPVPLPRPGDLGRAGRGALRAGGAGPGGGRWPSRSGRRRPGPAVEASAPGARPPCSTSTRAARGGRDPGVRAGGCRSGRRRRIAGPLAGPQGVHLHLEAAVARDGPAGTRSAVPENWPLAITTVVAGPSCSVRPSTVTRTGRGRCQARSAAGARTEHHEVHSRSRGR